MHVYNSIFLSCFFGPLAHSDTHLLSSVLTACLHLGITTYLAYISVLACMSMIRFPFSSLCSLVSWFLCTYARLSMLMVMYLHIVSANDFYCDLESFVETLTSCMEGPRDKGM